MCSMKFILGNLCSLGMVIVILCTVLCGIVSADSERDTGSHGWPPAINQLTFPATINIKGQVLGGNDGNFNPSFVYLVSVYLEETPVSDPENPANADKVKLLATIQPDTNGKFSYQYQYIPEKWQFLRIRPVTIQKVALALIQSPSPDLIYQPDDPALTFDLAQIWYNSGSTPVDAGAEWRVSPFTIANPLQKEGVQAHTELEINPAVSLGTKIWNCTTITEPGYYILGGNITTDEYGCIQILSSDVVFDGNNKKIQGRFASGDSEGIDVDNDNVTISNIEISGWDDGIVFINCNNGIIRDSNIHDNSHYYNNGLEQYFPGTYITSSSTAGIVLANTSNIQIFNNKIYSNNKGIDIWKGENNTIGGLPPCGSTINKDFHIPGTSWDTYYQNMINGNHIGIYLDKTNNNKIISNVLFQNQADLRNEPINYKDEAAPNEAWSKYPGGILVSDSDDNDIKMNNIYWTIGDGIQVLNSSYNKIYANEIWMSYDNGITLQYNSHQNLIHSNRVGSGGVMATPDTALKFITYDYTYSPEKEIKHYGSTFFIDHTSTYNNIFNNIISVESPNPLDPFGAYNQSIDSDFAYEPWTTSFSTPNKNYGPNIVGGPSIGGNFWETHQLPVPDDTNNDGFYDKAFCAFKGTYCVDPNLDAPGVDHYPLVQVKNVFSLSPALTGDLCQNPPDATLKFSNQNLNQVRNPSGSITLSPTQPGGFKNIVRDQPPNQSVVSQVEQGSVTQPSQPTSLISLIVSIPQTVMSFVHLAPAPVPETQTAGRDTVVNIMKEPSSGNPDESMHIVVLPPQVEQGREQSASIQDSVRMVQIPDQPDSIQPPPDIPQYTGSVNGTIPKEAPTQIYQIRLPSDSAGNRPQVASRTISCPAGSSLCQAGCVDTMTDTLNCGSCNNACSSGYLCFLGECQPKCSGGQTFCNGVCVNLLTDPANCGTCGNACTNGGTCGNGQCVLPMVKIQPTGPGGYGIVRQHL